MSELTFFVPGTPVPFTRVLRGSRQARAERYRAYRQQVGWLARQAGAEVWDGPIGLCLDVYLPERMRGRPDLDNIVKSFGDALNAICYADDRQITMIEARAYTAGGHEPGVRVTVLRVA